MPSLSTAIWTTFPKRGVLSTIPQRTGRLSEYQVGRAVAQRETSPTRDRARHGGTCLIEAATANPPSLINDPATLAVVNGDDRDNLEVPVPPAELRLLAQRLSALLRVVNNLADDEGPGRSGLAVRISEHLGADPLSLPVLSEQLPPYQLIDVQVALEVWASAGGREAEVVGVSGEQRRLHPLGELLRMGQHVDVGPVEYQDLADSPSTTRRCVRFGLFLLSDGPRRFAVLVRGSDPHGPMRAAMIEVLADDEAAGRGLLVDLRSLAVQHSVLRGQVLALGPGEGQSYGQLRFVPRPVLARDQVVLPEQTLAGIERHVVGMAQHSERLRAAGLHLKRGVLLYGPPGTGKTHTVRYLLGRRPETTAFLLSGQALGLISQACTLARAFTPSLVVLEDVDLIAGDRSLVAVGSNPLLFEVLNQIDGLSEDVDVTFLLTTNRVDILERALAQRPGRVDAAIEIAVPDADCRVRLLRLYGTDVGLDRPGDAELVEAVEATDGATATFLREVVRRAALVAAERRTGPITVDGATLAAAARELAEASAVLARASGGGGPVDGGASAPTGWIAGSALMAHRRLLTPGRQAARPSHSYPNPSNCEGAPSGVLPQGDVSGSGALTLNWYHGKVESWEVRWGTGTR
jgi:cell division protease FtsH